MNWQPIETAPKDGTHILVCFREWDKWQYRIASCGQYEPWSPELVWRSWSGFGVMPEYWQPLVPPEGE